MSRTPGFFGSSILGCALALTLAGPLASAHAKVLYSFCKKTNCADGAQPNASLIQDSAGNLYGTTLLGGANGAGTVFRLTKHGKETVLYSFCSQVSCADGQDPRGSVIRDGAGNIYGTTSSGGIVSYGGTVFKVTPGGTETVLYSFCAQANCTDGRNPNAGLIEDGAGNLYGTTFQGGEFSVGTVFKLAPNGTETVLHSFCSQANCADGQFPSGSLIEDSGGNLYGTTQFGGSVNGAGTVFRIAPDGTETVLYAFCPQNAQCPDGAQPASSLIEDEAGNLYGTTSGGGLHEFNGTIFKLAPNGTETVLYSFCAQVNCTDGANPQTNLIKDGAGNFYGTTTYGGPNCYGFGCGTAFKLAPDGTETVLHAFCSGRDCDDGATPNAGLTMDSAGHLYGTTTVGGNFSNEGTVFKLKE